MANSKIPCECECFEWEHRPINRQVSWDNKDITYIEYDECLICDDCRLYRPMSNLDFLEWECEKRGQ